jgi:uncharacterized membrane protein YphA (DoxX/SURF4 family)
MRGIGLGTLYARLALAIGFLSAVADRLGLWGGYGSTNVAWGDWQHFLAYTAKINPELSSRLIPPLGAVVTAAECVVALGLLLGWRTRLFARLAGILLLLFALGMTTGTGVKSALDASVFAASAGAFLLGSAHDFPFSLDAWRGR